MVPCVLKFLIQVSKYNPFLQNNNPFFPIQFLNSGSTFAAKLFIISLIKNNICQKNQASNNVQQIRFIPIIHFVYSFGISTKKNDQENKFDDRGKNRKRLDSGDFEKCNDQRKIEEAKNGNYGFCRSNY